MPTNHKERQHGSAEPRRRAIAWPIASEGEDTATASVAAEERIEVYDIMIHVIHIHFGGGVFGRIEK